MLSEAFLIEANETIESQCTKIADAINANINLPMTAAATLTEVTLTSKWKGESANDLVVSLVELSENDTGVTYAIVQPSGGAVNPGVQTALNQVGNVWESLFLNCLNIEDTTALDLYSNFGEGRWGSLVRKPCVAFSGNTKTTVSAATTISDARKNDRTNAQLVAPGSDDLPLVVAARQLARIAKIANNNPPHDYGSQQATGLIPGADGDQWTYADRDQAVKKGSSTVEVRDGVVTLADTVTFYHPTGDPLPAYRYVVDIIKLQNIIFNIDLIFNNPEWDGAPLLPDDQPTVNRTAKKPKTAVAAVCALLDSLALNAILSNPEAAKASTLAAINDQNPKRLDVTTTVQLSGNTNIISVDLNFGFYFGVTPVVA
jgi:phage tail sheath gpL-like